MYGFVDCLFSFILFLHDRCCFAFLNTLADMNTSNNGKCFTRCISTRPLFLTFGKCHRTRNFVYWEIKKLGYLPFNGLTFSIYAHNFFIRLYFNTRWESLLYSTFLHVLTRCRMICEIYFSQANRWSCYFRLVLHVFCKFHIQFDTLFNVYFFRLSQYAISPVKTEENVLSPVISVNWRMF